MTASPSTSSWTAPWRRRAASPPASTNDEYGDYSRSPPRATSPPVGAVSPLNRESEDEGQEFYDSEGGEDDDVSSFGGSGTGRPRGRLNSFGEEEDEEPVFGLEADTSYAGEGRKRKSGGRVVQHHPQKRNSEDEGAEDEMRKRRKRKRWRTRKTSCWRLVKLGLSGKADRRRLCGSQFMLVDGVSYVQQRYQHTKVR